MQAIDTLIGDINPPAELMQTQTDRKIAEEQRKTYEVQEAAQKQRQQLVRADRRWRTSSSRSSARSRA